jgi:nitrogen-specific signal transduction histidine kinase
MPELPPSVDVKDLYYRLFSHLPDCLVVVDRQHRVILSNWRGGFEDVPLDKRGGLPACAAIFHPDDAILFTACPATEVFRSGRPTNREFLTSPLGNFECRAFPIFDQAGEEVDYVALQICNVSERKKLKKGLILCQRMETASCMAAGLAHDFNNLLTVVGGFGQILQKALTEPRLQNAVAAILEAEQRARSLVERLMMIGDRSREHCEHINLNGLLRNLQGLLRTMLGNHIQVDLQLDEKAGIIRGTGSELEQVILNLAINSRDAMPKGGRLTIVTTNCQIEERTPLHDQGLIPGAYVVLTVRDTGHGMDAKTQERIFDPFFTTKGKDKGTGLGMTVVFSIVRRHHGHIALQSSAGEGTTVEIYLPR